MTELVLVSAEKHLIIYNQMCNAIGVCHRIDECKDIADKSVALAAYYKQIKDDATVQMFNEVRLRAWRRIGKLFDAVDVSKCETQSAKIHTIRAAFDNAAMTQISDTRIREILQLSAVSDDEFESAFDHELNGSIADLLRNTSSFREMMRANEEARSRPPPPPPPPTPAEIARRQAEAELTALQERHHAELAGASEAAMNEIGITLERKDRAKMRQVVFLIKENVHSIMRKAAFDQKVTMQEILRRGLKMWLVAHGYKFPDE